jgi:hypothetical protein
MLYYHLTLTRAYAKGSGEASPLPEGEGTKYHKIFVKSYSNVYHNMIKTVMKSNFYLKSLKSPPKIFVKFFRPDY